MYYFLFALTVQSLTCLMHLLTLMIQSLTCLMHILSLTIQSLNLFDAYAVGVNLSIKLTFLF
jgi:hypothetical protein